MNKLRMINAAVLPSIGIGQRIRFGHFCFLFLGVLIALGFVGGAVARADWQGWPEESIADAEEQDDGMVEAAEAESVDPFASYGPLQLSMADSATTSESAEPTDGAADRSGGQGEASGGEGGGNSVSDIATKLSNPVGDIWSITNQYNINQLHGRPFNGSRWQNNWNIQPVMPLHLTNDWNLVVRPVIPLFFDSPYPELKLKPGQIARTVFSRNAFPKAYRGLRVARRGINRFDDGGAVSVGTDRLCGIGDIQMIALLSPRKLPKVGDGQILWGLGPTLIFPTADPSELGAGKYQAGPSAVVGYLNDKWVALIFAQQWWSFAGRDSKPDQNHMTVQYSVQYMLAPGLQIGCGSPIINVDWNKDSSNSLTIPIGASISKVIKIGKLPVKFAFEYDYAVVHPRDDCGQRSIFRFTVAPVLPALIKENLLGD